MTKPTWQRIAELTMSSPTLTFRLRVLRCEENAFGPGKAELLESLRATGSLNRSAQSMGMSYVKALGLVRAMNEHFRQPLVELSRGGHQGGGTQVTPLGLQVLREYLAMKKASEEAAAPGWMKLRALLKE